MAGIAELLGQRIGSLGFLRAHVRQKLIEVLKVERGRTEATIDFGGGAFIAAPVQHHLDVLVHIVRSRLIF